MRKFLLTGAAVLALAACSDSTTGTTGGSSSGGSSGGSSSGSSSSSSGGSSSGGTSSAELSAFVLNLIAMDTTETALPTDLTTVMLDTSSEDPTPYASLFAPGS